MLTQIHPEIGLTGPNEELKQNDAKWIWWLVVQEKSFRPTMVCYGMLAHSGVQHFTAVWLWHITCIGENHAEATSLSLSLPRWIRISLQHWVDPDLKVCPISDPKKRHPASCHFPAWWCCKTLPAWKLAESTWQWSWVAHVRLESKTCGTNS